MPLLTGLTNLLASGRAPPELRPYIGGARCAALKRTGKDCTADVRPACSGETICRIAGKALLASELDTLKEHVSSRQLALGVACGQECMAHVVRQWRDDHVNDEDTLGQMDEEQEHVPSTTEVPSSIATTEATEEVAAP